MADELQALLDKINEEGVKKAERQQADILEQARQEARQILADAQATADRTVADARQQAALLVQKGEESLRQAARDIMLSLRQNLQTKVQNAVTDLLKANLVGANLTTVIAQVISAYLAQNGATDDITVLVPAAQCQALEEAVKAQLADNFKAHCSFAPVPALAAGFKLVFSSNVVMYDFSDQALAEAVTAFAGPKIASALTTNN